MWLGWLRDPWHLSVDIGGPSGFCLWALRLDGLHVAPYDRHPDGDGSLRALGMDARSWRCWYDEVVARLPRQQELASARELSPAQRDFLLSSFPPDRVWIGAPAVAARLAELYPRYERMRDGWRRDLHMHTGRLRHSGREGRTWWRTVSATHGALPPTQVSIVDYPSTIIAPSPPATLVIATPFTDLDWPTYSRLLVAGVEQLAAA
jgi:hypothetical protein